jgi:hypothetical protein
LTRGWDFNPNSSLQITIIEFILIIRKFKKMEVLEMSLFWYILGTFAITSIWYQWSHRSVHKSLRIVFVGFRGELDSMSKELGYKDITEYWTDREGVDFANNAKLNLDRAIKVLS